MNEILYGDLITDTEDRAYYTEQEVSDLLGYTPWRESDDPYYGGLQDIPW